jgi:hypothetical protein
MRSFVLRLSILALCLTGVACDPITACTDELRYSLSGATSNIRVGESFMASVRGTTCGGRKQVKVTETFSWTSDAPDIASVDATGRVLGRFPGQTTIRVESEGFVATLPLTVIPR